MVGTETLSLTAFPKKPLRLTGLEYRDCFFDNCSLAAVGPPGEYSYIGQSAFHDSKQRASGLSAVALDDVLVDGLGREGNIPLFLSAVVFRHVTLRGRLSMFKLNSSAEVAPTPAQRAAWVAAQREFYRNVDWALDISQAQFTFGPDLHHVPGHLIRRDEETQVLVTRATLADAPWRALPWGGSALEIALQWFLEDGPYDDAVLVAARKAKAFRQDLAAIEMLRREGLVA